LDKSLRVIETSSKDYKTLRSLLGCESILEVVS